ncbi:MAG: TIGR03545 family protein [Balneolaceae bacterium]|nr:TIGR03545 family protein [Balneolaceae bacterium]MBO6545329.1 TIGR03545 family protein [Balneolaceae bacterium]MBO6646725.1 TIGR03545 family protein [Balneolaceae bacterium]
MRIKGLIFVAVITALVFLASWISIDSYIESEIEYQASIANGAVVEIDGFELSLVDLKIRWDRLQIANPENTWENSFETGEAELDFLFWPTLWERVIIEDIIFKDFRLDSERETDGYFEMPVNEDGEGPEPSFIAGVIGDVTSEVSANAETEFLDIKADVNVDSLLAKLNLQAPEKIDSLKHGLEQKYSKWDSTLSNTDINQEIAGIKETIEAIDVKNLKQVDKALAAIQNVQKLTKQVDSLKNKAQTIRNDFQEDFGDARFSVGRIDNWIKNDYDRALKLAKLPTIDAQNIAQTLFGQELFSEYAGYLEYAAIAREYSSKLTGGEDEEKIERFEGKDYKFSDKYEWPSLWIQNIDLSGETKTNIQLAGKITNISSDQSKTKEPIKFDLGGQDDANRSMNLTGEFNYLEEEPRETIRFEYAGFGLAGTKLSPSELLPYELVEGTGEIAAEVNIIDRRIDSEIQYQNKGLKFDFGENPSDGRVQQLIRDAVSSADQINVTALVDNVDGPLKIRIRSNIDNLFVDALKSTVSREVEQARARIENEVQQRIGDRKEELLAFKDEKEAEIRQEYDKLEAKVNEQLQIIEQKKEELEKRKKEIEEELKNKAADELRKRIGF